MHSYFKQLHGFHKTSLSYYSRLIDHCLSLKSVNFVKIIHAQLIKVGFNSHTFLGNRCLDVYFRFGDTLHDALKVYDEITEKNLVSWNICLKGLSRFGEIQKARHMLAEMPERDVVSWNSMISGYVSCGFMDNALEIFSQMQIAGVRPSEYTFSIMMTLVTSACYGCHRSGYEELALDQFFWMRATEYAPDEFTISTVINVCCNLLDLEKGKQTFAFCFKVGFFSNSIVSSAAIDLLSKCNRLEDAIRLFEELDWWDSAVCNSMISSYAQHGCGEDVVQLFVLTLRENLRPTEFTLSSMLSSVSIFLPAEPGSQIHSLVVKLGFESDVIVASSLVDLYSKAGLVNYAMKIFSNMGVKDLITWNTIIMGLAHNGKVFETLSIFKELVSKGAAPDNLTLAGVLLACNFGGFIEEGMTIFLTMEKEYGIVPGEEHYAPIVDLLCRAGKLREAMDVLAAMPYEHGSVVWESILRACVIHGDFKLTERVAKRMMKLVPHSSLPYLVLARAYEMRGKWESMIWVRKAMILNGVKNVVGCCWIGIQNHVYTFNAKELQPPRGKDIYLILRLLSSEMEAEDYTDNLTKVALRR
ncbi:pentatricopeptide repeat-containing protein At1g43980, mitochondrial isoform X2 [Pyrus x bretschneideri]|uniref:pentatricopeptide repeat-containing protein At1g43980, mitochondrial isoform X2 n=1 Tax=Pyrus x bretschneideri TaxID=225117 RepID=UPI0020308859|nr:pentatricopeptide repeat-containing protein At1g43980, mitochondrial isoform X2 [Pyrus x bretschneideri]